MVNDDNRPRPFRHGKFTENEFMYLFNGYSTDSYTTFRNCDRKNNGCKARVCTVHDVKLLEAVTWRSIHDHNHDSNAARVVATEI
jgi:hypothetical protein